MTSCAAFVTYLISRLQSGFELSQYIAERLFVDELPINVQMVLLLIRLSHVEPHPLRFVGDNQSAGVRAWMLAEVRPRVHNLSTRSCGRLNAAEIVGSTLCLRRDEAKLDAVSFHRCVTSGTDDRFMKERADTWYCSPIGAVEDAQRAEVMYVTALSHSNALRALVPPEERFQSFPPTAFGIMSPRPLTLSDDQRSKRLRESDKPNLNHVVYVVDDDTVIVRLPAQRVVQPVAHKKPLHVVVDVDD